ncbi:MAG TPA: MAPEG family protein [Polyangiaceae bacterium]|jgi:hypothetical protein
MKPEAVFGPVSALALWTGVVVLITGIRRIQAVRRGRMPVDALRPGETSEVPYDVAVANRNLMNLLEMPLLFYVVCICLYVTTHIDHTVLQLAWAYFALRLVHSLIHLTWNRVTHRLVPFALSNFVLLALWILFMSRAL